MRPQDMPNYQDFIDDGYTIEQGPCGSVVMTKELSQEIYRTLLPVDEPKTFLGRALRTLDKLVEHLVT